MKRMAFVQKLRLFLTAAVFVIIMITMLLLAAVAFLLDTFAIVDLPRLIERLGSATFILFAAILSIGISTGLTFFLGSILLRPIRKYIAAMQKVARGDFSVRLKPFPGDDETLGLVASFNKMVRELGNIELLRNDFINNFSHEFKTPITSIRGYAILLQDPLLSEEEKQSYLEIIIRESHRLSQMSSNILYLNRIEKQGIANDYKIFNIGEQLRRCVSLLYERMEEKALVLDIDVEDVNFRGNEDILDHAWINLLDNAIKFTPPGGKIRVHLVEENRIVTVKIKDQGIGMSHEVQTHIFDKFYQSESSHAAEGYGLGLPIVKEAVHLHGGTVSVRSAPGEGSEFTVTLPMGEVTE